MSFYLRSCGKTLVTVTASNLGANLGILSIGLYVGVIGGITAIIAVALLVRSRSKAAAAPASPDTEFGGEFDRNGGSS